MIIYIYSYTLFQQALTNKTGTNALYKKELVQLK